MENNVSGRQRIKTAYKKQGFPSLTAGENWGKYLIGLGIEILFGLGLCLIALLVALVMLAVMK